MMQLPFIAIALIGVALLPFTIRSRNKREQLENELKSANEKISKLMVMEERQRIARDLHDTLGQKLSLIGIKSDLARKWLSLDQAKTNAELEDIQRIARTALKEVREIVSDMKMVRLKDEIVHIREILSVAGIQLKLEGEELAHSKKQSIIENVLCMCVKEAVTNVVKHSQANKCWVTIKQTKSEFLITVSDNGIGMAKRQANHHQSGLQGMKERLEFVNGNLLIESNNGVSLLMKVPRTISKTKVV
ncbi:sensor histidine kinase [Bacillus sp. JCM 19041]|uniref:sensor histidine kinase n=1 Tax=Bacillus sp. JCM 19041 TaxID=1460637 RepID=UPI000AB5FCA4